MTAYQVMPPLTAEEFAALEESIRVNGVLVPVVFDQAGETVDGHHRLEIAHRLNIDFPARVVSGSEAELRSLAYSLNLDRRHLSREQKRQLVEQSLKADPQLSDRAHARRTGASHVTVAAIREPLEESGQIDHFSERVDPRTGSPSQPATKQPSPPQPEAEPEPATWADGAEEVVLPIEEPHPVAAAVLDFPLLSFYADAGRGEDAVRLAAALRGYQEPELSMRLSNLEKTIAGEKRRAAHPPAAPGPDYYRLGGQMFDAVNNAARVISRNGGADSVARALDDMDPAEVELWRGQFLDVVAACRSLAEACAPKLRRVK